MDTTATQKIEFTLQYPEKYHGNIYDLSNQLTGNPPFAQAGMDEFLEPYLVMHQIPMPMNRFREIWLWEFFRTRLDNDIQMIGSGVPSRSSTEAYNKVAFLEPTAEETRLYGSIMNNRDVIQRWRDLHPELFQKAGWWKRNGLLVIAIVTVVTLGAGAYFAAGAAAATTTATTTTAASTTAAATTTAAASTTAATSTAALGAGAGTVGSSGGWLASLQAVYNSAAVQVASAASSAYKYVAGTGSKDSGATTTADTGTQAKDSGTLAQVEQMISKGKTAYDKGTGIVGFVKSLSNKEITASGSQEAGAAPEMVQAGVLNSSTLPVLLIGGVLVFIIFGRKK